MSSGSRERSFGEIESAIVQNRQTELRVMPYAGVRDSRLALSFHRPYDSRGQARRDISKLIRRCACVLAGRDSKGRFPGEWTTRQPAREDARRTISAILFLETWLRMRH